METLVGRLLLRAHVLSEADSADIKAFSMGSLRLGSTICACATIVDGPWFLRVLMYNRRIGRSPRDELRYIYVIPSI